MATTILGKVGLTPKGAWAEGTTYERLDVVSNGGSSYMSLSDNNTAALTDTSKWQVLVDATTSIDACNTAKTNAEAATTKAEAVNATLSDSYQFTVTDRNGSAKTLDLASPADVSELNDRFKSYVRLKFNVDKTITVDGVKVTCPANKIVKVYGKKITGIGESGWVTHTPQLEWADFSHSWYPISVPQESLLTKLDVSNWDTSETTSMGLWFRGLKNVEHLDVSGWDTSLVTSMEHLFSGCNSLTSLDVSGFDTSQVTSMYGTFAGCHSLASLDVSGWDTSKVTFMEQLFDGCHSLTSLDVSGFDTSQVTSMYALFSYNHALTSVDVSGWDTSKVTNMGAVFRDCPSLTSVDVSGWDTSSLKEMRWMPDLFYNCRSLANIKFGPGWGKQTATYTLDLSWCNSNNNYQLSDETWSSMLTMYDRATAGLTAMTIKLKSTANIPEGWEDSMAALGYTITKV